MNKRQNKIPVVAIVGRPNVGKSSLFNRLIHKRIAITSDTSGTTRDRIYYHVEIENIDAILVDTGGLEYGKKENIEADVQTQARLAINEADIILFVINGSEAMTANDYEAAQILRKTNKKILFIANKCDQPNNIEQSDFSELGFGEPLKISTIHKIGLLELEEELGEILKKQGFKKQEIKKTQELVTNICFIGRPNVGKSSLVNALIGEEKNIVSPVAGTTRDTIDTQIAWEENIFNLIDTAGLRRRGKIDKNLEKLSVLRSLEAIERSDVVCLILDYEQGLSKQDMHIASYVLDAGKGLLLVVNKCDLMTEPNENKNRFLRILRHRFDFLPWAPVIFISALKKQNTQKIFELTQNIQQERAKKIDSDELNAFMKETVYKHLPPKVGRLRPHFYSLEQLDVIPPTFVFHVNDETTLHFSYRRYLENELRKNFGFDGTSIKITYKRKRIKTREKNSSSFKSFR